MHLSVMDFFAHKGGNKSGNFVLDLDLYYGYSPMHAPVSFTTIAEPFYVITKALKICGNGPISYRKITYGKKHPLERIVYEVNWKCWGTVASAIAGVLLVIIWLLFLINIGLETPFLLSSFVTYKDIDDLLKQESADISLRGMVKKSYVVISVVVIIEIVSRWVHAGRFAAFLNSWEDFERKMAKSFPPYKYDYHFNDIVKLRDRLLLLYVTYPSMVLVPAYLCVYCSRLRAVAQCLATVICFQFLTVSLLEDVKVFMSYKAISQAFQQLRKCVERHAEMGQSLTREDAQAWRLLVMNIRTLCHRASEYNKVEELTRLAGSMILLTLGLYIILNGWEYAQKRSDMLFLLSMLGFSLTLIGRTYCKATMAEQINQEETLLASAFAGMSSSNVDATTVLELKCLADSVTMRPVQISFANYVVLNKRLLLKMFSQVVTYLIVLMQFNQPSK